MTGKDTNILRKTPDEIKKGLELCSTGDVRNCEHCPYPVSFECFENPMRDALAYIQQLEAGIDHAEKVARECAKSITENLDKLQAKLIQVERERDAAVADLAEGKNCADCKHYYESVFDEPCSSCVADEETKKGWQWRGVCEENTKEQKA